MARVIFLNRFYWPDEPATAQLLTDLAGQLAARGRAVSVITSHPGTDGIPRDETHRGVRIIRVGGRRAGHPGLLGKATDWGTFLLAVTGRVLREARPGDTIVAMTDPPLLGLAAWLVSVLRGTRLVHWVQDIYPELAMELTGHRWLAAVRPFRDRAWRRADVCVTPGADMAGVLAARGVAGERIRIVPNWAPAGLAPTPATAAEALRCEWGLTGKFVLAYSGNLGRVHDLDSVLALAEALRDEPRFAVVVVGGGAQRAALEAAAVRRKLSHVQFRPAQPRSRLAESLAVGDVHLVTLLPGCERYVFPSKLYGIAAIGRPVVFIGPRDCELARIVAGHGLGLAAERTETAALATAVRELADHPARCARHADAAMKFTAASGGAAAATAAWETLLPASGLAGLAPC